LVRKYASGLLDALGLYMVPKAPAAIESLVS